MVTPEVQAQVAEYFGEAPANPKACQYLDAGYGSYELADFCTAYRVNDRASTTRSRSGRRPRRTAATAAATTCIDYSRLDPEMDRDQGLSRDARRVEAGGSRPGSGPIARPSTMTPGARPSAAEQPAAAPATAALYRHRSLQLLLLLTPPVGWFGVVYLGSLALLLVSARSGTSTRRRRRSSTTSASRTSSSSLTEPVYRTIAFRTVGVAALVTRRRRDPRLPDRVLHGPHRVGPRTRAVLFMLVLLPLWASYLVKVYAWRVILAPGGPLDWVVRAVRASPGVGPGYPSDIAMADRVQLPLAAVHDPADLRRASSGSRRRSSRRRPTSAAEAGTTFRRVVLPLALPAVVAGSIFTFSLTLGDYITPQLVSNSQFIGNVIYDNQGVAGNIPFAAAYALVPVAIMARLPARGAPARRVRGPVTSRAMSRMLVGLATLGVLVFLYLPIVIIALYAFNADRGRRPGRSRTARPTGSASPSTTRRPRGACGLSIAGRRWRRRPSRCVLGLAGRARRPPVPVLRPRGDLVPARAADRAARASSPAWRSTPRSTRRRHPVRRHHDRRRPRDVLRRRRLQQRHRPAAALVARRSRRRRWTSAPTPGRRSATSRSRSSRTALLAGGLLAFALSFDEVIVTTFTAGTEQTLPIWILSQPAAAQPAADRQRGRGGPDHPVGDPGLPGAAAQQRRRRARPARLTGRVRLPATGVPAGPGPGARSSGRHHRLAPIRTVHDQRERERRARQPREGRADTQSHVILPPGPAGCRATLDPSGECPIAGAVTP